MTTLTMQEKKRLEIIQRVFRGELTVAVLDRYLPEHNRKFSKPVKAQAVWRKASPQQIEQALCFKQQRTVATNFRTSLKPASTYQQTRSWTARLSHWIKMVASLSPVSAPSIRGSVPSP